MRCFGIENADEPAILNGTLWNERCPKCSFHNFLANASSAIAAYCFFDKKPAIDVSFVNDGQLSLF